MSHVNKLLVLGMFLCVGNLFAQSADKLKKEQARLEKNISSTESLLAKSKTKTRASLNDLRVIQNQIEYRERLLKNYDNQIRGAELTVQQKEKQIIELRERVTQLKAQYKKLLIYAYKHRNNYGKLMYIFTADSYNEARKRNSYLRRLSDVQLKQFLVIQQNQDLISEEIGKVNSERENKLVVLKEKKRERGAIEKDRATKEKVYQEFKQEEELLLSKLKEDQKKKDVLRKRIAAAIKREIALAEARRKEQEAAAALAAAKKNEASTTTTTVKTPAVTLAETKEAELISNNFASNRGRLPWPVEKGNITEKFGKNPHPTLKNVSTNNRGIDISAPLNAQVRAVFDGEVTSVLNIPGAGKVVIIKHGNYRTVYSNLQDTYVKSGSKVTTKKVIGSLLAKSGETISVVHFEVHQVVGSNVTCLNPTLWVSH
ncbi:MAG: peptidoglycan DD-metalloendopeptidase family protein [Crocinitomicaceae bacterium]|nr:peptidoglycan DD-metalloendopeptidase family protein [Flavobacteriales bacterium]NQZ35645.1 peptidoglycan DD-metalloendopeptidase family protein [Crocinitomicaceae bacterium]